MSSIDLGLGLSGPVWASYRADAGKCPVEQNVLAVRTQGECLRTSKEGDDSATLQAPQGWSEPSSGGLIPTSRGQCQGWVSDRSRLEFALSY